MNTKLATLSHCSTLAVPAVPAAAPPRAVKRKTRITIYLDDEVLSQFRSLSAQSGKGYQTLINAALRTRLANARGE